VALASAASAASRAAGRRGPWRRRVHDVAGVPQSHQILEGDKSVAFSAARSSRRPSQPVSSGSCPPRGDRACSARTGSRCRRAEFRPTRSACSGRTGLPVPAARARPAQDNCLTLTGVLFQLLELHVARVVGLALFQLGLPPGSGVRCRRPGALPPAVTSFCISSSPATASSARIEQRGRTGFVTHAGQPFSQFDVFAGGAGEIACFFQRRLHECRIGPPAWLTRSAFWRP